jgi:hypothetical protein
MERIMSDLRVPLQEVSARLLLQDGNEFDGSLFNSSIGAGGRPGSLVDRLNDRSEKFVPFAYAAQSSLVNKSRIVWIELATSDEAQPENDGAIQCRVTLTLTNGLLVEGWVRYELPPERQRLLDYLNSAGDFVAVFDDQHTTLVNLAAVVRVENTPDAPPPA